MQLTRRPMNVIQGPIAPFITKDPPRFYKTHKKWNVNVGDILRNQSDNTQLIQDSVLAVSRSENQTRYGRSSYTPKVNKEFRPPLIDPEYDNVPLSRIPRPRTQLRINPDASGVANSQNIHGTDVSSFIDARVMSGSIRPTFTIAFEKDIDRIIPDLHLKMPEVTGDSYMNTPIRIDSEVADIILENKNPDVYACARESVPYYYDQTSPLEDLVLEDKNPNVHAKAGIHHEYRDYTPIDMELDRQNPEVNVNAGIRSEYKEFTPIDFDLDYHNPQVEAFSKTQHPYKSNISTAEENIELDYNNPQTSGISGYRTNIKANNPQAVENLQLSYKQSQTSARTGIQGPMINGKHAGEDLQLKRNTNNVNIKLNPGMMTDITQIEDPKNIKTINPIQVKYKGNKNLNVNKNNVNKNPVLRETLNYTQPYGWTGIIPQGVTNMTPKLKNKKGSH